MYIFRISSITSAAITRLCSLFPPPGAPRYTEAGRRGPAHKPIFTIVCRVGNKSFTGEGSSKKEAKISCSLKALEAVTGQRQTDLGGLDKRHVKPRAATPTTSATPR